MAIIEFNYNQAISQANQIETVASEMLNVANKQLQTSIDSIGVCWQGDASQQFVKYCSTTQSDIRAEAKKLQDLSKRLREVARIIKEAEERAKEIQRREAEAAAQQSGGGGGGGGGGRF